MRKLILAILLCITSTVCAAQSIPTDGGTLSWTSTPTLSRCGVSTYFYEYTMSDFIFTPASGAPTYYTTVLSYYDTQAVCFLTGQGATNNFTIGSCIVTFTVSPQGTTSVSSCAIIGAAKRTSVFIL